MLVTNGTAGLEVGSWCKLKNSIPPWGRRFALFLLVTVSRQGISLVSLLLWQIESSEYVFYVFVCCVYVSFLFLQCKFSESQCSWVEC